MPWPPRTSPRHGRTWHVHRARHSSSVVPCSGDWSRAFTGRCAGCGCSGSPIIGHTAPPLSAVTPVDAGVLRRARFCFRHHGQRAISQLTARVRSVAASAMRHMRQAGQGCLSVRQAIGRQSPNRKGARRVAAAFAAAIPLDAEWPNGGCRRSAGCAGRHPRAAPSRWRKRCGTPATRRRPRRARRRPPPPPAAR